MRRFSPLFALALLLAALFSCKGQFDTLLESGSADEKFDAAFTYFNNGKYNRATKLFESLAVLTGGTERDDTVQFYWGLSSYRAKDYYTAESTFERFLQEYPRSPFAEQAEFLHVNCLYKSTLRYELDQTPTYKALAGLNEYLLKHLDSVNADAVRSMIDDLNGRLDKKAFENARLYYKMEDYKASRVAFRNILKDDADNRYREDILYYTAMSSYKFASLSVSSKQKERFLVFTDDYLNFIGEYPESEHRKELDALYEKVKRKN